MISEWPVLPFSEVAEMITDGAHESPPSVLTGGVPMASVKDMQERKISVEACRRISTQDANRLEKLDCIPQKGDLLIAKDGSILKHIIVFDQPERIVLLSSIALIRFNDSVDPYFAKCYLEDPRIMDFFIGGYTGGSAIPRFVLKEFKKFPIHVPPLDVQRFIVRNIKSLDDAMTKNDLKSNCISELINSQFRSWFIDFDPVKAKAEGKLPYWMDEETAALFPDTFVDSELGLIPAGWKVKSLLEVSNLYDNLRVPLSSMERNERKGNYPYHGATSVMDYVDDFIFDGVHLLIAEDGSVLNEDGCPVLQYVWGKFWVNNHAHVLQGKDDFTTEHLHQYLKHFYIQPFVTGAVQLKINQKALHNVKLVIAPPNINNAFNKIIQSLYRSIRENKMKNEILTLTRDALLPRLMSGELKVPMEA